MSTKLLEKLYYDPKNPGSYSGLSSFLRNNKKKINKKFKKNVKKWILGEETYTLHKPSFKNYKRNQTVVFGIANTYQADLIDLQKFEEENDGFRYLLCVIDVFKKCAWVVPLKTKTNKDVIEAFKIIFKDIIPKKLHTDQGNEFLGKTSLNYFKSLKIKHFYIRSELKASTVERFNRTLKEKMWRYFTKQNTVKYIDVLDDLVYAYNNTYHRSIKMKPSEVSKANEDQVFFNLYGIENNLDSIEKHIKDEIKLNFKVGDLVRISLYKKTFEKGYEANWSEETFFITKIILNNKIPVYKIKDRLEEEIEGVFYEKELQIVYKEDETYKFTILEERKNKKGETEYFVNWVGYPDKFNSWINEKDVL